MPASQFCLAIFSFSVHLYTVVSFHKQQDSVVFICSSRNDKLYTQEKNILAVDCLTVFSISILYTLHVLSLMVVLNLYQTEQKVDDCTVQRRGWCLQKQIDGLFQSCPFQTYPVQPVHLFNANVFFLYTCQSCFTCWCLQAEDRSKRFNYLLEQTEIFGHFMSASGSKSPKSPLKVKNVFGERRIRKRHPSEGAST